MIYIVLAVLTIFVIAFIVECRRTSTLVDVDEMKETFIFKHPCGDVVSINGKPMLYPRDAAIEYAKTHPYHYVKNCYDNEYHFAYSYFNITESKTI